MRLKCVYVSDDHLCIAFKLRSQPHDFINFHRAALLAQRSSQCAAVLLTLLVLKVNTSSGS